MQLQKENCDENTPAHTHLFRSWEMNDLGELICHFAFLCVRQVLSPHTYMKLETKANVTISVLGYFGVCFFVFVWFFFACFVGFVGCFLL